MNKNAFQKTAVLMVLIGLYGCSGSLKKQRARVLDRVQSWVCNYSADVPISEIGKFDLAVLDADSHPDLDALRDSGLLLMAYVSLGEVGDYRWYWPAIANKPWILEKNPNWGGRMIDVRATEWHQWVVERIIPKIVDKGFDGLFLDTIDNAEYLEKYHPKQKYPGAMAAMVQLIRTIRRTFPEIYLVANRGFALLDGFGDAVDALVAESVFTTIDFETDSLTLRSPDEIRPLVTFLVKARKKFKITVLTLDYLDSSNRAGIQAVLAQSRRYGFMPYIATPKLDKVFLHTLD